MESGNCNRFRLQRNKYKILLCNFLLTFCIKFEPKRDEVTGEWRKLHNEKLNDLYSSPNIVWVIKSRRMRLEGHVARMGERRGCTGF
jgi:hypothetical protein